METSTGILTIYADFLDLWVPRGIPLGGGIFVICSACFFKSERLSLLEHFGQGSAAEAGAA